uniref:Uncharacterized protein n=1 Tax=Coccolithus braarudii TaxID=221442 RepID=A0A7S0L621_9EUKA|mmetsp:Transcript_21847/g.47035  ORF Transcript_21847/g.47035 Transcript_21847/m.47035 type:complete len:147 (+) Transcript_21847:93-533(+)
MVNKEQAEQVVERMRQLKANVLKANEEMSEDRASCNGFKLLAKRRHNGKGSVDILIIDPNNREKFFSVSAFKRKFVEGSDAAASLHAESPVRTGVREAKAGMTREKKAGMMPADAEPVDAGRELVDKLRQKFATNMRRQRAERGLS